MLSPRHKHLSDFPPSVASCPDKRQYAILNRPRSIKERAVYQVLNNVRVLENVISFIPQDRQSAAKRGEVTKVLHSVVSLCQVREQLGLSIKHFGPTNQTFWRAMVLRCFDFTVDSRHRFNVPVIDHHEQGGQFSPSSLRIQNLSLRHKLRRPTWYLHENLKYWKYLGIYFRPSQFQFLSTIQMGEQDISAWPKHENAFTLFSDLAFLVDKISILSKHVYTNLSQTERAHPCLLSRMSDPVIPDRDDLMLLKQCGIMPHFWTNGSGAVSPKWSGLAASSTDGSDMDMFPVCHPSFQQALETLVKRECSDWRVVQATNSDTAQENTSLIFYLGQTIRSQRWLGFVGSKLQYQHSQN